MTRNTLGACKRREFLKTVTMAGLALAGRTSLLASEAKKRPNILFFFVDDMGWQDVKGRAKWPIEGRVESAHVMR